MKLIWVEGYSTQLNTLPPPHLHSTMLTNLIDATVSSVVPDQVSDLLTDTSEKISGIKSDVIEKAQEIGNLDNVRIPEIGNLDNVKNPVKLLENAVSGLSISVMMEFIRNLSWEQVVNYIKEAWEKIGAVVKRTVSTYLDPYREFISRNKVLTIYIAIAIGIILIPILIFVVYALVVIGIGLFIFFIITGLLLGLGFILLILILIPIIILLGIIGFCIFLVSRLISKFRGGEGDKRKTG